jgi:hypothetical protein
MQPQQLIHKAAALLDLRGDEVGAVAALDQAIVIADESAAALPAIEARVFLAEVLLLRPGSETDARALLHATLNLAGCFPDDPDLVLPLQRRAEALLSGTNASSP